MASTVLGAPSPPTIFPVTPSEKSERVAIVPFSTTPSPTAAVPTVLQRYEAMRAANKERGPYDPNRALEDLDNCRLAMDLFLSSKMIESETLLREGDPKMERLYLMTGYALIEAVKALMSFEDKDLLKGIDLTRKSIQLASQHRKHVSLAGRLTGLVISSHISHLRSMTPIERHAELIYAEALVQKGLLGIVYSGDWLHFIKEALNMRSAMNTYHHMYEFMLDADANAEGGHDDSLDEHWRSGVLQGMGVSNLVLSLLPGRVISIAELFGYKGDRKTGLDLLMRAGGWTKGSSEPSISVAEEGLRRSLCDMTLLIFHLVLSAITFTGVDLEMAETILNWNLKRYPTGVFWLYSQGRLLLYKAQPKESIEAYRRAIDTQSQYVSLHHICNWEIAISHLSLVQIPESLECWRALVADATWSKAVYTYAAATCLVELVQYESSHATSASSSATSIPNQKANMKTVDQERDERNKEAKKMMATVPGLMQRIAGKSIPMEKFVARKAQKYAAQGGRLLLPAFEFGYVCLIYPHTPRDVLINVMLPRIEGTVQELKRCREKEGEYMQEYKKRGAKNNGYWDDYALAHFLKGVCLRFVAFPDPQSIHANEPNPMPDAVEQAKDCFETVLEHGLRIEIDHYLVYSTHYELARLYARMGDPAEAKRHLELVLSGKPLETNVQSRKGKYSMENAIALRAHAALDGLEQGKLL